MGVLLASLRLLLLASTVLLVPIALVLVGVASLFGRRARYAVIVWATPLVCRIYLFAFGIRLSIQGRRGDAKIFVGNHISYLDIFVAGSAIGGIFVSRHDVKDWPVFGWLARIGGTVFLDRASLRSAGESSEGILERVESGAHVTLFPEGGILPGPGVKPFKPLLLASIAAASLPVQPFAIRYDGVDQRRSRDEAERLARWDDEPLHTHAWRMLRRRRVLATVVFAAPVAPRPDDPRGFAAELRQRVEHAMEGEHVES